MGVIQVAPESPVKESRCDGCGGTNYLLHGYVYEDGNAHAIYFAEWCGGDHPERAAFLTLGLGDFAEGSTSADRRAFGIEWSPAGMTLLDEPVRDRPDLLGTFVPRDRALAMKEIGHVWHVVDHIVVDDSRLAA